MSPFRGVTSGRVPGLDGWRAVSILLVIFSHCHWAVGHPAWMEHQMVPSMGKLGVRCFFVISGFLITLLMLRETTKSGTVDVQGFYRRRILRIFPVYFAFLTVLLVLQCVTKLKLPLGDWLACLTFTRNFFGSESITGHLWSLGIEQQFYLIWPLVFFLLKPHRNPTKIIGALMVPILLCPVLRVTGQVLGGKPTFSDTSFFLQADALAIGCIIAIVLWHYGGALAGIMARQQAWLVLLGIVLMFLPPSLPWQTRIWWLVGCASAQAQAWGFSILLVVSIQQRPWLVFRLLDSAPMVFIGSVSYSLYIWQQIFWTDPTVFGGTGAWWNSFPGWMSSALVASVASYYLVERPFLRLKRGGPRRAPPTDNPASRKAVHSTPES